MSGPVSPAVIALGNIVHLAESVFERTSSPTVIPMPGEMYRPNPAYESFRAEVDGQAAGFGGAVGSVWYAPRLRVWHGLDSLIVADELEGLDGKLGDPIELTVNAC